MSGNNFGREEEKEKVGGLNYERLCQVGEIELLKVGCDQSFARFSNQSIFREARDECLHLQAGYLKLTFHATLIDFH